MAAIRTLEQFQAALDKELAWRIKEIGTFNVEARTNGPNRKAFIRAGIALVYAHWEGFIKASSEIYLEYINNKNLNYTELKSCFAVFGLKSRLNLLVESRKSAPNIEAFDFIMSKLNTTAQLNISSAINTESNLTSAVFCNIATSLDIDTTPYSTKFNMIDKSLVKRRNAVAHGEYIELEGKEFSELTQEMLALMRHYKTDLENSASLEAFRRTPVEA